MKSIKQQYIDLKEGKMSQHNFMRSVRMSLPQYVTNVTSFDDTIKILKNKRILSEADTNSKKEQIADLRDEIKALMQQSSHMDPEKVSDKIDALKKQIEDLKSLKEDWWDDDRYEGVDEFNKDGELDFTDFEYEGAPIDFTAFCEYSGTRYNGRVDIEDVDLKNIYIMPENKYVEIFPDDPKYGKLFSSPYKEQIIDEFKQQKQKEEEEGPGPSDDEIENYLSQRGLREAEMNTSLRNPEVVAKLVATNYGSELSAMRSNWKEFEKKAINYAGEEMHASGMNITAVHNLLSGYGYFEDWLPEYLQALSDNLESLNEGKKPKITPEQAHPSELRMGIRVEMEHTDDPKKAEKIALDHLAENPFYYTAMKLAGIENPVVDRKDAPRPVRQKKNKVELVDKANEMKKVKIKENFESQLKNIVREIIDEMYDGRDNLDEDGGFEQWKQALYKIVMEKAKLKADEIAIDDAEIKQYYQKGKTPEEVYFDIWQQDAGNFFNIPF